MREFPKGFDASADHLSVINLSGDWKEFQSHGMQSREGEEAVSDASLARLIVFALSEDS
jgi:hypothetical protein